MLGAPNVDAAIAAVITAAGVFADARRMEMILEDQRPLVKSEAIARIMSLPDPQKDGKPYSATAAEKLVETDAAYMLHRKDQQEATVRTIITRAEYEAAKFRAQMMTNLVVA